MSPAEKFVLKAESKCGSSGALYQSRMRLSSNDAWSATFVSCCAEDSGCSSVIPKVVKCQDIVSVGTSSSFANTGTWLSNDSVPEVGDVVLFVWSSNLSNRADKLGIVKSYDKDTENIEVVVGDYGTTGSANSTVRLLTYNKQFSCIKGYFRPNWSKVTQDAGN